MGQLSFYSADAHPRALSDLEGVLCARGQVVMFGRGTTARLSMVLGTPPPPEDPGDDDSPDDEPSDDEDSPDDGPGAHEGLADDGQADDAELLGGPGHPREPDRPGAALDPADLEFLDLDPEELAAVLAPPTGPRTGAAATTPVTPPTPVTTTTTTRPDGPAIVVATRADPVAEWRARALCCAFRTRGVDAELDRAPDGRPVVRSAFRADLVGLARRWTRGAVKAVPDGIELDGPRLRVWVLAAGRRAGPAYLLGLDPHAEHTHEPLLAASRRAGLGATLGGDRHNPVLRIVGRRRQSRLGELVGDPPRDLAPDVWPG